MLVTIDAEYFTKNQFNFRLLLGDDGMGWQTSTKNLGSEVSTNISYPVRADEVLIFHIIIFIASQSI